AKADPQPLAHAERQGESVRAALDSYGIRLLGLLRLLNRDAEPEGRAFADGAFHPHRAVMPLNQIFDQEQADARAADPTARRVPVVDAEELLAQLLERRFGNAQTLIFDPQNHRPLRELIVGRL